MVQHDRSEIFYTISCISYATSCRIGYIPIMTEIGVSSYSMAKKSTEKRCEYILKYVNQRQS